MPASVAPRLRRSLRGSTRPNCLIEAEQIFVRASGQRGESMPVMIVYAGGFDPRRELGASHIVRRLADLPHTEVIAFEDSFGSDAWLAGLAQGSTAAVFAPLAGPGPALGPQATPWASSKFLTSILREGDATIGLVFCIEEFELALRLASELDAVGFAVQLWAHHEPPADGHAETRAHREVLRGMPRALRRAAAVVLLLQRGAQARFSAALLECHARKRRGQPNVFALAGPRGYFPSGDEEREAEGDVAALVGASYVIDFSDFNAASSGLAATLQRNLAQLAGVGGAAPRGAIAAAASAAAATPRPSFKECVALVLKQLDQEGARPSPASAARWPAAAAGPQAARAVRAAAAARRSATT